MALRKIVYGVDDRPPFPIMVLAGLQHVLTLFGATEHPMVDELRQLNLDEITPLAALQRLQQWQQSLAKDKGG